MAPTSAAEMTLIDRYMKAIGKVPLLTEKEETRLAGLVKAGDAAARDKMILANLRLVVKIAYDYAGMGVPIIDLISEGNLGLIKSVDRFSPARGGRLATYAAWWIRQKVKKALADQAKMMRLPMHVVEKIAKLRRATAELTGELGREPTVAELSKITRFSQKRIQQLQELLNNAVSLEAPRQDDWSLQETIGDEQTASPIATLLKKSNIQRVDDILETMGERHASVLKLRHGLDGNPSRTLDEVGQILGLTRERVRQLEAEAQTQLKRILKNDDRPASKESLKAESKARAKVEVLREFMVEKGLLK